MSPLEVLTKKSPGMRNIVVFGSLCTVYRDPSKNSFARRAQVGSIVGCSDETKGFKVFLKQENKVITKQHVKNIKTLSEAQNSQLQSTFGDGHQDDADRDTELSARHGSRGATGKKQMEKKQWTRQPHETRGAAKKAAARQETDTSTDVVSHVFDQNPRNYGEAMKNKKKLTIVEERTSFVTLLRKDEWQVAMREELDALKRNEVWSLALRPSNSDVLHSKWVFKTKTTANGDLERHKARIVACEQVFGVDYALTFAAVINMTTVKVILALAATWGVPAKHGDMPNAYVKAKEEQHLEILMHVPKGITIDASDLKKLRATSSKDVVLELKISLYGLKQAGRLWSQLLHNRLVEADFTRCISDLCLYYKQDSGGVVIVGVYVDDFLITGTSVDEVERFFSSLKCLSVKDLGPVSKFLGMRVTRDGERGYFLDQEEAIVNLLRDNGMVDANPTCAPISTYLVRWRGHPAIFDSWEPFDVWRSAITNLTM